MKMTGAILLIIAVFSTTLCAQGMPEVKLKRVDRGDTVLYSIHNPHPYPVSVIFSAETTNMESSVTLPAERVLPALSESQMISFFAVNKARQASVKVSYRYFMGDMNARHDDSYTYRLPYQLGTSHRVSQAYNDTFSHTGQLAYSLDFEMPVGTGVYSSRGGIVVDTEEGYNEGGEDPTYFGKANVVTIMHDDGSFADYTHLKPQGVIVSVGQRVRSGQLIAYSGETGYVSGPHLHFHVKLVDKRGEFYTVPIRFASDKKDVALVKGEYYKAL